LRGGDPTFELTKAYYVVQSYAAAIAEDLTANIWYSAFGWRNSGLLRPDGTPLSAYTAYRFARSQLAGAKLIREITEYGGLKGYEFDVGGRRLWVLWSLDGAAHTIALPGTPGEVYGTRGDAKGVNGNSLTVALEPLYVCWP